MKKYYLAVVSWLCFGAIMAQAQYYNSAPPPNAPPPPYAPPPNAYVLPPGAGFYFRAGVGPSFYQNGQLTYFGGPVSSPVHYEVGGAANAAVGWAFNRYVSVDFQTGAQGTRIDSVPGYTQYHSDVYDIPFLANVTLSYPIPQTFIVPYIGAGGGGADTLFDAHSFSDGVNTVYGEENDTVYAWQVFGGVRFRLAPNISVGAEYRYFTTGNTSYSYPPSPNFDVGFKGVKTHSVLFTFEWKFW